MSSNYSSSRRGGQRSQTGSRRPSSGAPKKFARSTASSAKTVKVGFFGKILALFGLGAKKSTHQKKAPFAKTERTGERKERTPRTPRKPEYVEVTGPRLYIGNLSFDATESDLFELFSGIGQVQNVELVSNRDTHRSKGFGFIQMTTLEEAKRAVTDLHDKDYMGRKLVVSGAKELPANRTESRSEARAEQEATSETSSCGDACEHSHAEGAQ